MAAWRYEISLLVLKKYFACSLRSLEEKFRISVRPCNILYLCKGLGGVHFLVNVHSVVLFILVGERAR